MLPKADRDQFYIYLDFLEGTKILDNQEKTQEIENILLREKDIKSIESFVAVAPVVDFNGLFRGSSMRNFEEQSTIKVNLASHEERKITSEKIAQIFRENLVDFKKNNPSVEIKIVEDPPGPPVLATFLLKVKGEEDKIREEIALDMLKKSQDIKGIADLDISKPDYVLNYVYKINTQKAQLLGITPQSIATTLRVAISGLDVSVFHTNEGEVRHPEEEYIVLRLEKEDRDDLSVLESLVIPSQKGGQVSVLDVLDISDKTIAQSILADERQEVTYVSGEMVGRSVVYASIDLLKELKNYQINGREMELVSWSLFGTKYRDVLSGKEYSVEIDGEWKLTLEVFRDLGIAMLIAIFLIYFVLATKIKSFNTPLLIMISIPWA
jgi:multidrug efflux pump subunit AcrB